MARPLPRGRAVRAPHDRDRDRGGRWADDHLPAERRPRGAAGRSAEWVPPRIMILEPGPARLEELGPDQASGAARARWRRIRQDLTTEGTVVQLNCRPK